MVCHVSFRICFSETSFNSNFSLTPKHKPGRPYSRILILIQHKVKINILSTKLATKLSKFFNKCVDSRQLLENVAKNVLLYSVKAENEIRANNLVGYF